MYVCIFVANKWIELNSIIYDNLYQYQPMMSPVVVDIDKSDFGLPLVKGMRLWKMKQYLSTHH